MTALRRLAPLAVLLVAPAALAAVPTHLPGLHAAASVTRDGAGIVHVQAADEHEE